MPITHALCTNGQLDRFRCGFNACALSIRTISSRGPVQLFELKENIRRIAMALDREADARMRAALLEILANAQLDFDSAKEAAWQAPGTRH